MKEKTKEAIAVGIFGGWFYAKLTVYLLGYLMALAWPDWWASLASDHPTLAFNLVRLTNFIIVLVVLGLPFALALTFLLRERALLSAAVLGVSAFLSVHLFMGGPIWESWYYFQYYSAGQIAESAGFYVGPALMVWLGRTYNIAFKVTSGSLRAPKAP